MRPEGVGAHRNRHNNQYPSNRINNVDDEDDGYNGSSDNADDDEEEIRTLHISATSTRLEQRQSSDKGIYIFRSDFWQAINFYT